MFYSSKENVDLDLCHVRRYFLSFCLGGVLSSQLSELLNTFYFFNISFLIQRKAPALLYQYESLLADQAFGHQDLD